MNTPPKKTRLRQWIDNPWVMVIAATLLLWTGRHFDNSPQRAEHQFLVATAKTRGDVFKDTVLFVIKHRPSGATAVILNKPVADSKFYDGGPMEKDKVIALQSLDVMLPDTVALKETGIGVLVGKKAIAALETAPKKPAWFHIYQGYTGWGPHQLNTELKHGEWQLVEFNKDTLLHAPTNKLIESVEKLPVLHGN